MRLIWACAGIAALGLLTGCLGYTRGTLIHPQLTSVAIGQVANATDQPRLDARTKTHLAEAFRRDGSLKVVRENAGDCIVEAKILSYDLSSIGRVEVSSRDDDQRTYRTAVFRVFVNVEYSVTMRASQRTILGPRTVRGKAEYTEAADIDTVRREGMEKALVDAADQIVSSITEAY